MTAHAKTLTKRATNPAQTVGVFVNAFERLGYRTEPLLARVGVKPQDLADPDARISCAVMGALIGGAMQERPIKNLAARLAVETPLGAFQLLDYLILTAETVGAAQTTGPLLAAERSAV